ncbi:hypothetical protein QA943_02000 [Streptomyces sp. B21-097]
MHRRCQGAFLRGMVRRALAGDAPQPWWIPRRVLTVVSADVDTGAGVGAVWIVWRPTSSRTREHIALLERCDGEWRHRGGGSGPGDDPVDVEVLDVSDGGGVLSRAHGADPARSLAAGVWIGCAKVRLGRDVGHVLVGARRIEAPQNRSLIAVWASPYLDRGVRPVIRARSRGGVELSRVGPHDGVDSHTRARLEEEW